SRPDASAPPRLQAGCAGDLFRAPVLAQVGLDPFDRLRGNPWPAAGLRAAVLTEPLRPARLVTPADRIARQLAAEGAGRTVQCNGNLPKAITGFMQAADAISFVLVQAANGHGQLHLAVKLLRSGRLGLFTTSGVAIES